MKEIYYAVLYKKPNPYRKENRFKGYLVCEEHMKLFKSQRDMDSYEIVPIKVSSKNEDIIKAMGQSMEEGFLLHGFVMFPAEEDYYSQSFDQMIIDTYCAIEGTVKKCLPFLRLDKEEEEIIHTFLKTVFEHMQEYDEEVNDEDRFHSDEILDYDRFFKTGEMIKLIIQQFE